MRQRLFKAISCVALMLSVFFCSSLHAFADETLSEDELVAYIDTQETMQIFDITPLSVLDEDDYSGSALFQVLSQRGSMYFQYQSPQSDYSYLGAYIVPVYFTLGFQVERGHTYSGSVQIKGTTTVSMDNNYKQDIGSDNIHISSFVFNGYDETSPESVDVSLYPVLKMTDYAEYWINVNFNNYQSTYDGYVYINVCLHFNLSTSIYSSSKHWWLQRSIGVVNTHASDWSGTLKDYATDAIIDSDGSLIKNQTIQQQQIANQQAQQSQQQHDNLVNGYDNSQDKANQDAFDSALSTHESQEHALLDEAITNVSQVDMDLSWTERLTATFSFIRTVFMAIVTASGDFGILITVTLCFALALFALGWFRS